MIEENKKRVGFFKLLQDMIEESFFLVNLKRMIIFLILTNITAFIIFFYQLNIGILKSQYSKWGAIIKLFSNTKLLNFNLLELIGNNPNYINLIKSSYYITFLLVICLLMGYMAFKGREFKGKEKGTAKWSGVKERAIKNLYNSHSNFNFEKQHLLDIYIKKLENFDFNFEEEKEKYKVLQNKKEENKILKGKKAEDVSKLKKILENFKVEKAKLESEDILSKKKELKEKFGESFLEFLTDETYFEEIILLLDEKEI